MADYYPLIARAIEGLSDQTPEMRRAVYERARSALVAQLRSLDPPLSEPDIQKESRSLDDAIVRVEADFSFKDFDFAAKPPAASSGSEDAPRRPGPQSVVPLSAPAAFQPEETPAEADAVAQDTASARPRVESRPHPGMQSGKRGRTVILGAVLALVIAAIAAFAFLWRDKPEDLTPQVPVAQAPQPQPDASKNNDRVGAPSTPTPASPQPARQEIGVAQRAVLYEEDPANPSSPKAQTGRVTWRLEDINPGQGQPLQRAVTANLDIPDAGLTMRMVLRRNLDATLPASHTVEISFTTRAGDSGRVIRDVGLLQFKDEEAARGTPVAGLPVPVRENLFLIGLSNLSSDIERNTELFVRRNWIDLPVRMASGQRAILSFEKGSSGAQVLNSAFSQWQ